MLQTLNMIDMNKDLPNTNILGVIPKRVADDTTFDLSDEIINAVKTMEKLVIDYLQKLNFEIKVLKNELSIEEIAQISFKRSMKNDTQI